PQRALNWRICSKTTPIISSAPTRRLKPRHYNSKPELLEVRSESKALSPPPATSLLGKHSSGRASPPLSRARLIRRNEYSTRRKRLVLPTVFYRPCSARWQTFITNRIGLLNRSRSISDRLPSMKRHLAPITPD